jgi:FAD:protein FMN transferase
VPVRVAPDAFAVLARAARFHQETGGAFDITVGPLMRCWRFAGGTGEVPEPAALAEARERTGMHLVELDAERRTVRFRRPGVLVDPGAIGKGYALEQAALLLGELGVERALLHGGTSTVHGIGTPESGGQWKVAVEYPGERGETGPDQVLAVVALENRALSVSAVWGKWFAVGDTVYGHVLDPRTGWPAQGAVLAAVVSPSATETDALSTALLTLGIEGHGPVAGAHPAMPLLVLGRGEGGRFAAVARGMELRPSPRLVIVPVGTGREVAG